MYLYICFKGSGCPGEPSQSEPLQQQSNSTRSNKLLHHTAFLSQPNIQPFKVSTYHFTKIHIVALEK